MASPFALLLIFLNGLGFLSSVPPDRLEQTRQVALDAYIYAYPMVLMEITRRAVINVDVPNGMGRAPVNQFGHFKAFPDSTFAVVVRPNADTLYSSLWFDVTKEPLIIHVPDSMGRYYLLPIMDMWTDVFSSRGTRTTGNTSHLFAIAGPDWKGDLPQGVDLVRSPTPIGWMIGRTQTNGKKDYESVYKFQAGFSTTPLSQWGKPFTWPKGPINLAWIPTMTPLMAVERMDPQTYFSLFADLMKTNPPHAHDYPILDRIRKIGLEPGKSFGWNQLDPETKTILKSVPKTAHNLIRSHFEKAGVLTNGWRTILTSIGTYGTDYLQRAAIAHSALASNTIEDALYPKTSTDSEGQQLQSQGKYRIHFTREQLPPANAFWSLTLYDDRLLFAPNPIDRYAIGDRDPLKFNDDGSLDIYIQRESPARDLASNWLPAPKSGPFSLSLRLYWPKAKALSGEWSPPAVEKNTSD